MARRKQYSPHSCRRLRLKKGPQRKQLACRNSTGRETKHSEREGTVTKMLRTRVKKIPDGRGVEDDCTPSGEVGAFQSTNETVKAGCESVINSIDGSGAAHAVRYPGRQYVRCTQCLVRCPPHMGQVCHRCQKDGVAVCALPPFVPEDWSQIDHAVTVYWI
jgi:hypothetical protein